MLFLVAAGIHLRGDTTEPAATLYDYVQVDTVALIDVPDFSDRSSIFFVDDDAVYLFPAKKYGMGDSIVLFRFDHTTRRREHIVLDVPKEKAIARGDEVCGFVISDTVAAVLTWEKVLVFGRKGNEGFKLRHAVPAAKHYESIRLVGRKCFLSACRYLGDKVETSQTHIGLLDLGRGEFLWEKSLPDPSGSIFMLFRPRSVIDCSGREIMVADVDRYRIGLYDMEYRKIATLERAPGRWMTGDTAYRAHVPIPGDNYYPRQVIEKLTPTVETKSLIKRADFVNDSTILVSWIVGRMVDTVSSKAIHETTLYDIWRRSGKEWKLLAADLESPIPPLSEVFSDAKRWPLTYQYVCNNSYIVGTDPIPVSVYGGKTISDIGREVNEYYLEHPFRYSFMLYRFVQ